MRTRLLVATLVLALSACGGGAGSSGGGPPSAQTVAAGDSDWPGIQKCPESGSWDSYLKSEKSKAADQYQTDKASWDQLKAGGANDSYIAVYASSGHCGEFGAGTPGGSPGMEAYVYVIRFKDSSSAAASYKSSATDFHLSDSDVANLKAAGATVKTGSQSGLSDNATVITIDVEGATLYAALWQNKSFEVAILALNETASSSKAASSINGRIH